MQACMHVYIHTYLPTYVRTYIHTYMHPYIYIYIHTHTYVSTCIYIHTYIHIYIYTYIYVCTSLYRLAAYTMHHARGPQKTTTESDKGSGTRSIGKPSDAQETPDRVSISNFRILRERARVRHTDSIFRAVHPERPSTKYDGTIPQQLLWNWILDLIPMFAATCALWVGRHKLHTRTN